MVHVCLENDKNLCVRTVVFLANFTVLLTGCLDESDNNFMIV